MKTGCELITAERMRQIEEEGWSEGHDDETHDEGDLLCAGVSYALDALAPSRAPHLERKINNLAGSMWPWDDKWWKPTPQDVIRQLTKAGALIAAEIDRLQREEDPC